MKEKENIDHIIDYFASIKKICKKPWPPLIPQKITVIGKDGVKIDISIQSHEHSIFDETPPLVFKKLKDLKEKASCHNRAKFCVQIRLLDSFFINNFLEINFIRNAEKQILEIETELYDFEFIYEKSYKDALSGFKDKTGVIKTILRTLKYGEFDATESMNDQIIKEAKKHSKYKDAEKDLSEFVKYSNNNGFDPYAIWIMI